MARFGDGYDSEFLASDSDGSDQGPGIESESDDIPRAFSAVSDVTRRAEPALRARSVPVVLSMDKVDVGRPQVIPVAQYGEKCNVMDGVLLLVAAVLAIVVLCAGSDDTVRVNVARAIPSASGGFSAELWVFRMLVSAIGVGAWTVGGASTTIICEGWVLADVACCSLSRLLSFGWSIGSLWLGSERMICMTLAVLLILLGAVCRRDRRGITTSELSDSALEASRSVGASAFAYRKF